MPRIRTRTSLLTPTLATTAVLIAASGTALAASPQVILQDTGVGANSFANKGQTIQFDRFDRPVKSGTGNFWIMLARNTGPSAADTMFITGSGLAYNLVALEGTTEFEPGRTFNTFDRYVDINDSGDWVGIGNLVGGANDDDEVLYAGNFDGSSLSLPLREGQIVPEGGTLGTSNFGPGITNDGAVSAGFSIPGATTSIRYYTDNANSVVLQDGDTVSGETFSTQSFSGRNAFQTTSDGASYVVRGNIGSSSGDGVLVKDGQIVLRDGDSFDGRIIEGIFGEQNILQDNGDWLTRVRFTDGTGGAIKNGTLLAASGDPVNGTVPGETWSEIPWTASSDTTFALVTGDSNGNVVLGGFTDNPDTTANFVWTYNGIEILRSGTQLDLDADGTLDDAFIFTPDLFSASPAMLGGFLADDGYFYTLVEWQTGTGDFNGDAFIRVLVPSPGPIAGLATFALLTTLRRRRNTH